MSVVVIYNINLLINTPDVPVLQNTNCLKYQRLSPDSFLQVQERLETGWWGKKCNMEACRHSSQSGCDYVNSYVSYHSQLWWAMTQVESLVLKYKVEGREDKKNYPESLANRHSW